ncbi:MAG: prephenate dehydratase [Anaerolineaceae bacterium]|jgi:prephenate dehydratase
MKIAFQGEIGAFSEVAALEHFGADHQTLPCESFDAVFEAVESGAAERGLVPVENSLAGSVHRNFDLLLQFPLVVIGEHYLRVSHCLIGLPGASVAGLKKVISHPQALAQCEKYLRGLRGVRLEPVYDTAGSVKMVKEGGDTSVAAIAARRAADLYGMAVLAEHVEDSPANFTRFQAISKEPVDPGQDAKTSIVFAMQNAPGALFRAMSVFALREIDLTKIESRPLVGKLWEYFFYIDFVGAVGDQKVKNALANLEEYCTFLRVLGSYPRSGMR